MRCTEQIGVILGTAAYMSPEQAKGMPIDKRADIWAFGVVSYEMLVGRSLFAGDSVTDTLAGVLKTEIDFSKLPAATPAAARRLLRRCLDRNPRNRLHDIADARIVLEEILAGAGADDTPAGATAATAEPASVAARWLPWAGAAVAIVVAIAMGTRGTGAKAPAERPLTSFGLLLPEMHYLPRSEWPPLDLSADGQSLLVVAEGERGPSIFRRPFDRLEFTRIEGTDGAEQPILSPDGRTVAFFSGGYLRKVPLEGGVPVTLAEARAHRGACWGPEGSIIFSPLYNSGLWLVPITGGSPVAVTALDETKDERTHRWPQLLPDGNTVIFTVGLMANTSDYDIGTIDAVRLDTGERRTILEGARMARYSAGYLVFQRRQMLLAMRFDPERLERLGEPFVVQEGVAGDAGSGAGFFTVSAAGGVVFAPESAIATERVLVLVSPDGTESVLSPEPASFFGPRFSPSGDRLALSIGSAGLADDDVYLYELAARRMQRLTFSQRRGFPVWSPDGSRIAYTVGATGGQGVGIKAADGSGDETQTETNDGFLIVDTWLSDGRMIGTDVQRSLDVMMFDPDSGEVTPLFGGPAVSESSVAMSPDGRFLAYTSTESGSNEIFVESFPTGAGKWQVSAAGGSCPVWSRDGRELYFASGSTVMAAEVDLSGVFRNGAPRALFSGPYQLCAPGRRDYDVGPDGRFVLVKRTLLTGVPREMVLLQGWEAADPARAAGR